jgi:hypothetical protein
MYKYPNLSTDQSGYIVVIFVTLALGLICPLSMCKHIPEPESTFSNMLVLFRELHCLSQLPGSPCWRRWGVVVTVYVGLACLYIG